MIFNELRIFLEIRNIFFRTSIIRLSSSIVQRLRNSSLKIERVPGLRVREGERRFSQFLSPERKSGKKCVAENSIENSPREVPRRNVARRRTSGAMTEWSENKMNETNRRAKVVVKYAGGERPGERVFQVGEKGPRKADGRNGSADGRYSERSDIHSFLVTARCPQECSSRPLLSTARIRCSCPFYSFL